MLKIPLGSIVTFKNQTSFHPWFYFSIFLISNTLISYFPFSLSAKLWIVFLGLFLPFAAALGSPLKQGPGLQNVNSASGKFLEPSRFWEEPPLWLWFLF